MSLTGARVRLLTFVAIGCLAVPGAAIAQSGTASLSGTVKDNSGGVLPGVVITLTSEDGIVRTATTNNSGQYSILGLQPGEYDIRVELQGFRTAVREDVAMLVDTASSLDVTMEIGQMAETIEVTANASPLNTQDASMGNVITGDQLSRLPFEARSVVGALSLQPGAAYSPVQTTLGGDVLSNIDSRSGAVSGARVDQSNVTLDGVDVNDPQFNTAYQSAVRMTLDALQEFRVSTSNYNAEAGRSSGAQVTLVTKSGTNDFRGSGYYVFRDTATSSNEYFLKLSQLSAGEASEAPKLDKRIYGGSIGGPVLQDKFFFFFNYEGLREESESPILRDIPSASMRDGVLIYECENPGACPATSVSGFAGSHAVPAGFHGMTPGELASVDPLGIGPSPLVADWFSQYPLPNDPGRDGYNIVGYRFSAPIENVFDTYIGRLDFNATRDNKIFGRFNFQDDAIASAPQFPGQAASRTQEIKSNGFALGWDAVLTNQMVNTFRYGYTKLKSDIVGLQTESRNSFRFIDDFDDLTSSNGRETPTHNIVNDLSWIKGSHTLKFGTNIRFTRIPNYTNANSFYGATANASWTDGVGRTYIPGANCPAPATAACNALPAVSSGGQATYADSLIPILGIMTQADGNFNYDRDGNVIPVGMPTTRKFGSDEYEFYVQDSWKLGANLTITGGVRYSLYSPPWETTGLQVQPNVNLGEWFEQRRQLMMAGRSTSELDLIQFDLAGPVNNGPDLYEWDKNNFAPRLAVAYTPSWDDRMVIRGGYSMVYDRVGLALATQYDAVASFGLATNLSSPFGANNEDNPDIRFQGIDVLPPTVPDAPPGGFPQEPPAYAGVITSGLDQSLVTPYAHVYNVAVGRELGSHFALEVAYVGRTGRNQLVRRDMAMPANLVDPDSGVDYFSAAQQVIMAAEGIAPSAAPDAYTGLAPIAYWENMFPDATGFHPGLSATQVIAREFNRRTPDYITTLYVLDEFCFPACSRLGEFAYFTPQYDALAAVSSVGRSEYNALQVTLRKRWSDGYQFDVNYTLGHAKDHSSQAERGSYYTSFDTGGYSGFLLNSWEPDVHYGNSDYDIRHQMNLNWIVDLPFGRGRKFGNDVPGAVNAFIGEWAVSGLMRLTSGFPFNVYNCRSCWTTNWNLQGNASLVTPGVLPDAGAFKDVIDGQPSAYSDPDAALEFFRRSLPGEVGIRNELRGDGYFTLDLGLSKAWTLPWADHRIMFRWDTFNLTNTPRFDVGQVNMFPDIASSFGRYDGTLATCDGGAGRCMQFNFRYEF